MRLLREDIGVKMFRLNDGRYKLVVRSVYHKPERFSYYYESAYDCGKDMDVLVDRFMFYKRGDVLRALGSHISHALKIKAMRIW